MAKRNYDNWSKEELVREVEKLEKQLKKKYGLVWDEEKNPEKVVLECRQKLPVLIEEKSKEIRNNENKPINILIEGDNYHALSVLNYTHGRKIDVIYIDPPYNTGSKDFKYNDRYVDNEDSYRHSKWLSFMKNRLQLAKDLLSNAGVIFIQIDENEIAQLRFLCDEIFGPTNFRNNIIWAYRTGGAPSKKDVFASKHDYILFYSKSEDYFFNVLKEKIIYKKDFFGAKKDKGGNFYAEVNLRDVIEGEIELFKNGKQYKKINVKPVLNLSSERLMDFPSQKPIGLVKFLLEVVTHKNSLICDFFAGTGTTGEAVLELNKEDNGNRQFILCTNNENNIAIDICYPRIKRAIKGFKNRPPLGGNLKYFKTSFVNSEPTDKNKKKLVDQSTEMLCLRENCFDEVRSRNHYKIFNNTNNKWLGIIYDDDGIEPFKQEVKKLNKKFNVYVFSLDESAREEEFEDVIDLVDLKPIPAVILNVYRRIFK